MDNQRDHVDEEKDQEKQEVQVISVTNAVVDELAVVVEPLDALVAVVAVPRFLGPQVFAVNADVVKVQVPV